MHAETAGSAVLGVQVRPGELLAVVADGLAGHGAGVRRADDDPYLITVAAGDGMGFSLKVTDDAYVRLECQPPGDAPEVVAFLADIAACLLAGRKLEPCRAGGLGPGGLSLKSRAGRELRRRGLTVALTVYEDDEMLEITSEIAVTSPAAGLHAQVWISDDGALVWERDYWPDYAAVTWEPDFSWDLRPQSGALALAITGTVARAFLRPDARAASDA